MYTKSDIQLLNDFLFSDYLNADLARAWLHVRESLKALEDEHQPVEVGDKCPVCHCTCREDKS